MSKKIVLMDGAVGTSLWEKSSDKVPVWKYNIEDPDIVRELHREMIDAGAEIVLANTFSANRPSMKGTDYTAPQIVEAAMEIACDEIRGKAKIAMGVGPLTSLLAPLGKLTEDECFDIYDEMFKAAAPYKPDYIYLQTFIDLQMQYVAARAAAKYDIPLLCSMSFAKVRPGARPATMFGNRPEDIAEKFAEFDPAGVGINCGMGPEDALTIMEYFSEHVDSVPLIFKPNAGTPDEEGGSEFDKGVFAKDVARAASMPGVKFIGGCCGANAEYISALKKELDKQ